MYLKNFSQAQVITKASFSTCAYLRSVSDITLEVNATGCQKELFCCKRTAPSPYDEASAETLRSTLRSNKARTVGFVSSDYYTWFVLSVCVCLFVCMFVHV